MINIKQSQLGLVKLLILTTCSLYSCDSISSKTAPEEKRAFVPQQILVDTLVLKSQTFHRELVSNGELWALQKSDLEFRIGGQFR